MKILKTMWRLILLIWHLIIRDGKNNKSKGYVFIDIGLLIGLIIFFYGSVEFLAIAKIKNPHEYFTLVIIFSVAYVVMGTIYRLKERDYDFFDFFAKLVGVVYLMVLLYTLLNNKKDATEIPNTIKYLFAPTLTGVLIPYTARIYRFIEPKIVSLIKFLKRILKKKNKG